MTKPESIDVLMIRLPPIVSPVCYFLSGSGSAVFAFSEHIVIILAISEYVKPKANFVTDFQ